MYVQYWYEKVFCTSKKNISYAAVIKLNNYYYYQIINIPSWPGLFELVLVCNLVHNLGEQHHTATHSHFNSTYMYNFTSITSTNQCPHTLTLYFLLNTHFFLNLHCWLKGL
jgi:hypothetical protein